MQRTLSIRFSEEKSIDLGRVTVFLGVNGAGKTSTLQLIRARLVEANKEIPLIYIEGGRSIRLYERLDNVQQPRENVNPDDLEKSYWTEQRISPLSNRVQKAFNLLIKKTEFLRGDHADAIDVWISAGQNGHPPGRGVLPLDKLFSLFSEIFPRILIRYDKKAQKFLCIKDGGNPYSFTALSDGEKQVLLILAEIAILAQPNSTIIVDEPELNLNGMLANKLWSTLEDEFSEMTFIYATHNIAFCNRDYVEAIFIINEANGDILPIHSVKDIPRSELHTYLGMMVNILSSDRILLTEGSDSSFDAIFYRWIMGDPTVTVVCAGGGADVHAITKRQGIWNAVLPTMGLRGVIDRDFKANETLSCFEKDGMKVMHFHEAESYVCLPSIVVAVSQVLGLVDLHLQEKNIEDIIFKEFECNKLKIIANRVADKLHIKLGPSIQKNEQRELATLEQLTSLLANNAQGQVEYVTAKFNTESIKALVRQESEALDKVSTEKDIVQMLQLTPAKGILAKIYRLTGAGSPTAYLRACVKHVKTEDHSYLLDLRNTILQ